jgi:hypothetical protein
MFYMPHMITVDRHGNVWVTDVALQQAIKFSPSGDRLVTLGEELEPGHDNQHFCKPTQVRRTCQNPMPAAYGRNPKQAAHVRNPRRLLLLKLPHSFLTS